MPYLLPTVVMSLSNSVSFSMINADFCTGAVLISFGAVLGKTSPVQLLVMAIFEVTLFAVNEFILLSILGVSCKKRILYYNVMSVV